MRGVAHCGEHKMIYLTGIFGTRKCFLALDQNAPVHAPQCPLAAPVVDNWTRQYQSAHKKSAANHVVH